MSFICFKVNTITTRPATKTIHKDKNKKRARLQKGEDEDKKKRKKKKTTTKTIDKDTKKIRMSNWKKTNHRLRRG
jgi:hypothetical protein